MKHCIARLTAVLLLGLAAGCARKASETVVLGGVWKFQTGDSLAWAGPEHDDAAWKPIRPDRTWESQGWDAYDGYGWYRVRFALPRSLKDSATLKDSLQIVLGRIDDTDQTFLNGRLIGQNASAVPLDQSETPGPFTGDRSAYSWVRRYTLPADDPRILWDKVNTLAVRVHDHGGGGGLYSHVPTVSMVDLKDYVQIDAVTSPFESPAAGRTAKTVFLRNRSAQHAFKGELAVQVLQLTNGRVLFHEKKPIELTATGDITHAFTFEAASEAPARVSYAFREAASGRTFVVAQEVPYILTPPVQAEPRINGAKVYGQRPGKPFLYRIAATGTRPMTFSAEGLPQGLTLCTQKGILSGVVADPGEYKVLLRAKNAKGEASRDLKIVIGDPIQLTPPMGWNSWNCWGLAVDDEKVRAAADAFESSGLADHGWTFINIDDGWEEPQRRTNGEIVTNRKFPDMKKTADYVHSKGLKFGIYSSPGPLTCGGYTGSYRHELQDAQSYAKWGIDYLKYDWCSYGNISKGETREELMKPYRVMRNALNKVSRDIVFSLCQYGMGNVWEWGAEVGGNLWRTTGDITDTWKSMTDIGFDQTVQWKHAAPGHWNDPDMLVVGWVGWGPTLHPTQLTANEQYTHISLWCLLSAPLLLGCDLTRLDAFTLNLLTNDEVLAVNQDPLGAQARRIADTDSVQVWAKPLEDGSTAVGIFNLSLKDKKAGVSWADLGISGTQTVRDLWRQKDIGAFSDALEVDVFSHGVVLVSVGKSKAD